MTKRTETAKPIIDPLAYVHSTAIIEGDVRIGANCQVGAGVYIDGRQRPVRIAANTIIGSLCVIEGSATEDVEIGEWVTVQPGAVIQGARIGDWAALGANCVMRDASSVGIWASLSDGAVLCSRQNVPDCHLGCGAPAQVVGEHGNEHTRLRWQTQKQRSLARHHQRESVDCALKR